MAKWQLKYRVDWEATDGQNEGAQQNSVGNIDGHGEIQRQSKGSTSSCVSRGLGPGEGIPASQPPCGLVWRDPSAEVEGFCGRHHGALDGEKRRWLKWQRR